MLLHLQDKIQGNKKLGQKELLMAEKSAYGKTTLQLLFRVAVSKVEKIALLIANFRR